MAKTPRSIRLSGPESRTARALQSLLKRRDAIRQKIEKLDHDIQNLEGTSPAGRRERKSRCA